MATVDSPLAVCGTATGMAAVVFSARSVLEPVPDNRLHDPVLARAREPLADAEVQLPVRRHVQIENGKQDVMLFGQRIEMLHGSRFGVVLDPRRDFLRDVLADFGVRLEGWSRTRVG